MSNIYLNEPPTSGKVLLHTSVGDIDIELWAKEAPLACRNFIQLSLEGYYDGTLFHRVIKDFMAQGGDPTNSGKGGASSWGRPFKDEIHGRIKFNHRGQLAMANENKPNTNQSQFFLTLGDCEWLNRKHTIFGKVTGNTIFNLLRMSEVECGDDERPIDDIILKSVEVLWNPFDDIIPRNVKRETGASDGPNSMSSIVNKKRRKGKKDLKLLSFADDDTEVEHDSYSKKMISAHDVETRGCVDNSKLSSEVDPSLKNLPVDTSEPAERDTKITNKRKIMASTIYSNDSEPESPAVGSKSQQTLGVIEVDDRSTVEDGTLPLIDHDVARNVKLDNKSAELLAIKKDIMRSRRAVKVMTGEEAVKHRDDAALRDFVTPLERQRQRFLKRKREHGDREQETLSKLMQFSSNLKTQKKEFNPADTDDMQGCNSEVYHGQILVRDDDDDDDKAIGTTWHVGKLKFRKHIDDAYRIGSDGKKLQDYTVIDPR